VTEATHDGGDVRIGGTSCTHEEAVRWATQYLTSGKGFAYPSYDAYRTNDKPTLCDGDLLAPTVLNARPTITAYESLVAQRDYLNGVLASLPEIDLADASDEDLHAVASLYEPLVEGMPDVQGTTLSKVLHRKNPRLIPLYDEHILWCYRDAPGAPLPKDRERSWPDFMFLLARAIRHDLREPAAQTMVESMVVTASKRTPISPLRAWDILAWTAGKEERRG